MYVSTRRGTGTRRYVKLSNPNGTISATPVQDDAAAGHLGDFFVGVDHKGLIGRNLTVFVLDAKSSFTRARSRIRLTVVLPEGEPRQEDRHGHFLRHG